MADRTFPPSCAVKNENETFLQEQFAVAQELSTVWGKEGKRAAVSPWPGQRLGRSPAQSQCSAEAD